MSRKKKTTEWFTDYKRKLRCKKCGMSHPGALEFHHREPEKKVMSISRMVSKYDFEETYIILEEIKKCDVLCANCHRILHWEQYHN